MAKKELKERFFERFFYAEDGSRDWDRWRKQDPSVVLEFILEELDKAREEGYQKGWEDGSKGKVFEKIEVETEVTFKDLRDVIEGKEDAGEFLSKLTTK